MSYPSVILAKAPVAFWELQDGDLTVATGAVADSGTNAIDGAPGVDLTATAQGGPLLATDNQAVAFDGANDYADLTSNALLDDLFDGGGSVSFWIRPGNAVGTVVSKTNHTGVDSTATGWEIAVSDASGSLAELEFKVNFGTTHGAWQTIDKLEQDVWHHVHVSFDDDANTNKPAFFVNGASASWAETSTPAGSYTSDAAENLNLGRRATGTANYFTGSLSHVAVWGSVYDPEAEQVLHDFEAGRPGYAARVFAVAAPVAYWSAAEASGDLFDASGAALTLADAGTPSYGVVAPLFDDPGLGVALGASDSFTLASGAATFRSSDTAGTLLAWVRATVSGTPASNHLFAMTEAGDTSGFAIKLEAGVSPNHYRVAVDYDDDSTDETVVSPYMVPPNQWVFVAVSSSGTTYDIWIDGIKQAAAQGSGNWFADYISAPKTPTIVGIGRAGTLFGDGLEVSALALYDAQLTDAQITRLYREGLPHHAQIAALAAPEVLLPLDDPAGSTTGRQISGVDLGTPPTAAAAASLTYYGLPMLGALGFDSESGAARFNGADQYAKLEASAGFLDFVHETLTFSLLCWIKLDDPDSVGEHVLFGNAVPTTEQGFALSYENDSSGTRHLRFHISDGFTTVVDDTSGDDDIVDEDWHQVAVRGDGVSMHAYVDGILLRTVAFGTAGAGNATHSGLWVGRASNAADYFDGMIAAVQVHDTDVGIVGITRHWQAGSSFTARRIMALLPHAYYRLGETTGTTAADLSGNAYDGTYVASPTLGNASLVRMDANDKSITLDNASDEHVTVPSGVHQVSGMDDPFTVALWVTLPGSFPSALRQMYSHVRDSVDYPYLRMQLHNSVERVQMQASSTGTSSALVPVTGKFGETHMYTMRWDGANDVMEGWEDDLFVDSDVTVAVGVGAGSILDSGKIGGFASLTGDDWDGPVDEVVVFGSRISAEDLRRVHWASAGNPSAVVAVDAPFPTAALEASGHAEIVAELPFPTFDAYGGSVSSIEAPFPTVVFEGHLIPPNELPFPFPTVTLVGGGFLAGAAPAATAVLTGSTENVGVIAFDAPFPTLVFTGAQDEVALVAVDAPFPTVEMLGGASLLADAPVPTVVFEASTPEGGPIVARWPFPSVVFTGSVGVGGTIAVDAPFPTVLIGTVNVLAGTFAFPTVSFVAGELATAYDTFVMNLKTGAVTQYDHWEFDSIVKLGDAYLGFNSAGAYTVGGTTAAGTAFDAQFKSGGHRFGTSDLKRMYRAYISYKPGGDVQFKVYKDDALQATYLLTDPAVTDLVQKRLKISRGPKEKAKHWAVEFLSVDGGGLDIDGVHMYAQKLGRRFR